MFLSDEDYIAGEDGTLRMYINIIGHVKSNLFYKSAGYTEPLEFYEKFKEIDYFNVKVTVPFKSEECLEFIYGEDWKTPKKDFYYAEERKDSPTTI